MKSVSGIELALYIFGWTGAVLYSMYCVYLASDKYAKFLSEDIEPGWQWVGRGVDTADFEWKIWTPILMDWLKFVGLHIITSHILKSRLPYICVAGFSVIISFVWLWSSLGLSLTVILFIQPLLFIWISQIFTMVGVWITCLTLTLALHSSHMFWLKEMIFEEESSQEYLFSVILAWTHARTISFIVDSKDTIDHQMLLIKFYHYCFYLSVLPSGPLILYKDFRASVDGKAESHKWSSWLNGIVQVMRYLFWWFFHQLALHFLYHSALQYNHRIVQRLDVWSASGLGFSLGQFFMIKYTVLYGLPSALASLDDVDSPPPPKCISRVHLYSQMWRDFDRGLYNFMLRYIYIPCKRILGDSSWSSAAGSALCFSFVCIWHGVSSSVVIWCVTNYLGVCLEMTAKYCSTLPPLARWKETWSPANWTRFEAAAAAPLLLVSALSNFCFFTDAHVGYILAYKAIIEGGIFRLGCILLVMYCCCHVSLAVSRLESKKGLPIKSNRRTQQDE